MVEPTRRVGLLGGSFDPPHAGHLWMAKRARSAAGLDEVWLIPAYRPPHKEIAELSPWRHRAAMAALLAEEEDFLSVDLVEQRLGGISYTIDTVRAIKGRYGAGREFVLIIGEDSLRDLETWKDPAAIFAELEVLVLARAGEGEPAPFPCRVLRGEMHPAQSRLIRRDLPAARRAGWLTPGVMRYLEREGLYTGKGPQT